MWVLSITAYRREAPTAVTDGLVGAQRDLGNHGLEAKGRVLHVNLRRRLERHAGLPRRTGETHHVPLRRGWDTIPFWHGWEPHGCACPRSHTRRRGVV